jgi:hypothetical protein
MTSLGLLQYSEINDNSAINSNMTETEKRKQARHNITIKKRHDINNGGNTTSNNDNVQNMLKLINNSNGYENDDSSDLADFNPPPRAEVSTKNAMPKAMGQNAMGQNAMSNEMGQNAMSNEMGQNAMSNETNLTIDYEKPTTIQKQNEENKINVSSVKPRQYPAPMDSYEGFNTIPKTYAANYYKQYVPYINQSGSSDGSQMNKTQLLEKLNYMIHLLEEQRDEKTGHVMEEVILYSFLGVFIIFIVDSFARVGKYTR